MFGGARRPGERVLDRGRRRFLCALIVAAVAGGAFVVAQTSASLQRQPTFRTATDTVEVDVSVRDASGQPIRGLTKADFTIPGQTITAFEEVSREVVAGAEARVLLHLPRDVSDNRTTHEASLVVIVIDDQVPLKERARAGALARQIVDRLGPGVRVICPVWRRPNGEQPVTALIELIDEHDTAVLSTPAPISGGASPGVDAVVSLAGAPPGAYRLRITAGERGSTTSREVGVAIK